MLAYNRSIRRLMLATLATVALSACAGVTPINDLMANPGRYDGKTVRVEGTVKGAAGALGVGGYQLDDGTGTLTVISERGGIPTTGARISVKGTFEALATLGTRSLAVLREESRDSR